MSKRRRPRAPVNSSRVQSSPARPERRPSSVPEGAGRSAQPSARRPWLALGLVGLTVVILLAILVAALSRAGSATPSTVPTAIPASTRALLATPPGQGGNAVNALSNTTNLAGPNAVQAAARPVPGIGILDPKSGSSSVATSTPKIGQPAPNFSWRTTSGHSSLKALRGHTVLLEFFAPWCVACQQEVPWIDTLVANYGAKGFTALSVSASPYGIHYEDQGDESPIGVQDLATYRQQFGVSYQLVFDPTSRVFALYGRGATYPTYSVIDSRGIMRFHTDQAVTTAELTARVRAALPK